MKVGAPLPRTAFGPYEIVTLLGQGGGGAVYRAWDPRLEREVALKLLQDRSASDPRRAQRFIAEARAASALNHPNIVTVLDAAFDGGTPYIVSELIEGRTLREELANGLILFEMAADRHAFRRETPAATLDAIINDEPKDMPALDARMPPVFRWIVDRCLAKEMGERYAATRDLHRDLKTLRDRFGEIAS